jgi:hypothetical protein
MARARRWVLGAGAACVLALPAAALAGVVTVTSPSDPLAVPSCPGSSSLPCTVVSRTTAWQDVVEHAHLPMQVRHDGRIVGWEITLSAPSISQIKYFDANEGGTSQAAVVVLRHVHGLDYRVEATTPIVHLEPYFGSTAAFPLLTSIPVSTGDLIGLTVPTWVPALELRAGRRTAWRASRAPSQCSNVTAETAQTTPGSVAEYGCIYQTALVSFGAIEISTP